MKAGMVGLRLHHWSQLQVTIGNVKSDDPARRQMALVELEGFSGKQMDRDCVAGKCIHRDYVIILRRLRLEREPRIAVRNLYLRLGLPQVREDVPGHDLDARINFVEAENVSRLSVGRQCSGSQTDVGNPARSTLAAIVQGQANSRIARIVGG